MLRKFATIPPETDDWLHDYCWIYFGVNIPRTRVCEDHVAPFEAFAHSYFARDSMVVWEASRAFGGKSFLLSLLSLVELVTLGANIRILGGSGEQSRRVNTYIQGSDPNTVGMFWDAPRAPKHMLFSTTRNQVRTTNGGFVEALMASQTSVRGAHPARLRIDEADTMELPLYDAAMGQTMSLRGVQAQTTVSSTHHLPDGVMSEVKRRAAEQGYPVMAWCYKETMEPHGWLPKSEVERKRREVPAHVFANEFDLQEPNPEGRVFTPDVLSDLFDKSLGDFEGRPREECVVIEPSGLAKVERGKVDQLFDWMAGYPVHTGGDFYHAADWAKKQHFTIIHSNKKSKSGPDILASWMRMQRMPWPIMIAEFNNRVEAYGGHSMHDATGVGDVVHDYLTVESEGHDFNRRKETAEMFSSYVAAVEAGELAYPQIKPLYDAHRFLTIDQLWGSEHLPDEIAAAALAWRCREAQMFELLIGRTY